MFVLEDRMNTNPKSLVLLALLLFVLLLQISDVKADRAYLETTIGNYFRLMEQDAAKCDQDDFTVVILNPTYGSLENPTEPSGEFGNFLKLEISSLMSYSSLLREVPSSQDFEMMFANFPPNVVQSLEVIQVDAALRVQFIQIDQDVKILFLLMRASESAEILSNKQFVIPLSQIPQSMLPLQPSNLNQALRVQETRVTQPEQQDLDISIIPDRGNGGRYYDGEELVLYFSSESDCYVKVYYVGVDGSVALIFPNQFEFNNFMPADTLHHIPNENWAFAFLLGAPYGAETIKIVAQTRQFTDIDSIFNTIQRDRVPFIQYGVVSPTRLQSIFTQGIITNDPYTKVSDATCSYTILQKQP